MTTQFNLSINSTDGPGENGAPAHSASTNINTENPDELIAVLQKLSGLKGPLSAKPCGCNDDCDCEVAVVDEESKLANAAPTQAELMRDTMTSISDAPGAETGHTPSKGVRNTRIGDNPLADLDESYRFGPGSSEGVYDAIMRRLVHQHPEVLKKYGFRTVEEWVAEKAAYMDNLEEIGTSDISIWTRDVINDLERYGIKNGDDVMAETERQDESKWRYGCGKKITVSVPRGYGYREIPAECGSTSYTGGVNQCSDCADKIPEPRVPDYGDIEHDYDVDESVSTELEESLARDWQRTKLEAIAEDFNLEIAEAAIKEGKDKYTHNFKDFAIRKDDTHIKIYPILEGRVMTMVPLFVTEADEWWASNHNKPAHLRKAAAKKKSALKGWEDPTGKDTTPAVVRKNPHAASADDHKLPSLLRKQAGPEHDIPLAIPHKDDDHELVSEAKVPTGVKKRSWGGSMGDDSKVPAIKSSDKPATKKKKAQNYWYPKRNDPRYDEGKELTEEMRLVKSHAGIGNGRTAKIYKDTEWGEYHVKHFLKGVHQKDADYHCDDLDDANASAQEWTKKKSDLKEKAVSEVITKKTSAGKIIGDFEKSDNPKFKGDSKEQRKKRALGAYYGMHPDKSKK